MSANAQQNDNIYQDLAAVRFAVLALLATCIAQLGVGIYLIGVGLPGVKPVTSLRVGVFSVVVAFLLMGATYAAYRLRSDAVLGGFIIACCGTLSSAITLHPGIIILNVVLAGLVFRGYGVLTTMNERIDQEAQQDPMTQYYHRLIPILVRVMGADGHIDRRERLKISTLCNTMNISTYERNYLIKRASRHGPKPQALSIQILVEQFLKAAESLEHVVPDLECMYAALAVIESDGVVLPEEIDILQDIGVALGWSVEEMRQFVLQNQTNLFDLDLDKAYEILSIASSASMPQVERAHAELVQELNAEQFKHIGTALSDNVDKRKKILDKALALIKENR